VSGAVEAGPGASVAAGPDPGSGAPPPPGGARPLLFVITGERGAGKSVVCARLASQLREAGAAVGGIFTERGPTGGGREAVDIATGERRPFGRQEHAGTAGGAASQRATTHPVPRVPPPGPGITDPLTPSWHYDDEVFRWGNGVFEQARGCRVLIVDELGPLESTVGGDGPPRSSRCGPALFPWRWRSVARDCWRNWSLRSAAGPTGYSR
jgi:hypothetical protein